MKYGTLVKLSAQEILACNSRKMSCAGGGRTEYAFEYIKEHGIGLAKDYPYKARSWPCLTCKKNNKKYKRYRIKRYERVTCSHDGDESHLQRAVARQPITASIKVGKKFSKFKGGIWNEEEPFGIGHAVCVVGYGVYKNLQVWICKNSYGRNWGNSGYFYVQRKTDRKYGRSGILKKCYYPIVEEVYDESDECGGHDFSNKASPADPTRTLVDSETSTVTPSGLMSYFCGEPDALAYGKVLRMEGMLVDEYGRCEDPIREMGGMLVDEYGSNTSTIQLAGLLSSHIYDFSNNVSPADPTRTVVDSETSTVTPSGLMSYFCGEPDALAYGKVTMSLSHLIKSRLAFSTLLNQEGGIFSAFYKATRVLQRSLAPEIGGKKGSCFPNIHTTSQSSPMQAYNHSINDLDKELDHLKSGFEVTMSFSHHLKSRLAFSTLLNQEGGIFSAFYKATRVLQRSLGPEIGGKKGSCFPNIHTTSQSSPMQAYNHSINDLDKELDHLKSGFEVLRMEGMLVDEYGRCEDPIREMEGMLVDEYGRRSC